MKLLLLTIAALASLSHRTAFADDLTQATSDIPAFHQVSDGVYRGGHPDRAGLEDLAKLGVKTVIDLENDDTVSQELDDGRGLGLNVLSQPLSMFFAPSDDQTNAILADLTDPSLRPIFIHCTLGEDRTGLMVGLFRVEKEGVAAATAYGEMLDLGFKNHLMMFMDRYFKKRTGMAIW